MESIWLSPSYTHSSTFFSPSPTSTANMSNSQLTNTTIGDAASTGGFAALSSPSSHAGVGAASTSETTPIAPSTINALDNAPTTTTNSGLPHSSTTTGSGATHTRYEQPNLPATAQNLADKAPSGEQVQQKSHQYIDQAAELAAQAKTQAGELVAPKDKSELNEAEASLDSVTRGIAGSESLCSSLARTSSADLRRIAARISVLATAPLAGIEKISPVVAQKLDAVAQNIAQQYHSTVEPAAGQYAQQASDAVRSYLPASLGGKVS